MTGSMALTPLEGWALVLGQGFELAPVIDLDVGIVLIDPAVAEIDVDRFRGSAMPSSRIVACSSCALRVCGSKGFPGKVRAPTMSECEWVVASPVLTPNS
jgi:hypothetical protein